ncbi:hypothetical protein GEMRC1_000944 [Eukaryota sp. GEM-RC1]
MNHVFIDESDNLTDLAPDVIPNPDNESRRSFLAKIMQECCKPGDTPSNWRIENYIMAKHYESELIECQHDANHYLLSYDGALESLHKYWCQLCDPNRESTESLPIKPLGFKYEMPPHCPQKQPSFRESFCLFIPPCLFCLLPGHSYNDCPFQTFRLSDVSLSITPLYQNIKPKVLVRPEVMLDILLTMLHLQFVVEEKKLNLQVYDRTNNQFTLEMYKENQKVIEKSKATYKLKMLIFDIAHVIELIEKKPQKT